MPSSAAPSPVDALAGIEQTETVDLSVGSLDWVGITSAEAAAREWGVRGITLTRKGRSMRVSGSPTAIRQLRDFLVHLGYGPAWANDGVRRAARRLADSIRRQQRDRRALRTADSSRQAEENSK